MEKNTIEIDPATGLPALPEGYFWRVRGDEWGYLSIQLRRKLKWFGSTIQSTDHVKNTAGERACLTERRLDIPGAIKLSAERVLKSWLRKTESYRTYEEQSHYLGDYPPKKLEN